MSEFTQHYQSRIQMILEILHAIRNKKGVSALNNKYKDQIQTIIPSDIISAVHEYMQQEKNLDLIKIHINKLINLLYEPIVNFQSPQPGENSFLAYLVRNNQQADIYLSDSKRWVKLLNEMVSESSKKELLYLYNLLLEFTEIYTIKENVIFPILENKWKDFRCIQLMWAFHDDIRRDLKEAISLLNNAMGFNIKQFNRLAGDISFRIKAIQFRDEKILFPHILDTISDEDLEKMLEDARDLRFPFIQPSYDTVIGNDHNELIVDLGTGNMSVQQLKLMINHLPIDMTFVDENNQVQYFSTPKHRIFPRTKAIVGRNVSNCHPPDSVHIVKKIVDAFRKGEKDEASFWIRMGEKVILIRYFAVRDTENKYKGVLEVSQEISEIQKLEGEQRLLDWE